jgi:hypothetical protein
MGFETIFREPEPSGLRSRRQGLERTVENDLDCGSWLEHEIWSASQQYRRGASRPPAAPPTAAPLPLPVITPMIAPSVPVSQLPHPCSCRCRLVPWLHLAAASPPTLPNDVTLVQDSPATPAFGMSASVRLTFHAAGLFDSVTLPSQTILPEYDLVIDSYRENCLP